MREETEKWLEDNGLSLEKMIAVWELPPLAIIEAAENQYDKIVGSGEFVKRISVGWRIKELAEQMAQGINIHEMRKLRSANQYIRELQEEIAKLRTPWYSKLWRFLRRPL